MIKIAYWYTGIIIAAAPPPPCPVVTTSDGKLYANCFGLRILEVPPNLGQNLNILNISNTPIVTLSWEDMKQYPEIIELNMKSLVHVYRDAFDFTLLVPLKKIKVLHISRTLVQLPPLYLPPSITELYANHMPRTFGFTNFTRMSNLEHLELSYCNLHGLPSLSKEAPLDTLHLQNNFLNKLRYTDLAPYCLLREVLLEKSNLSTDRLFDHCCDISIWLEDHNIINTIECKLNSAPEPCDREKYTPHPNAILAYDRCLIRNGLLNETTNWVYIFCIVILVILVILIAGYGGFKIYHHHKSKKSFKEIQKRN